MEGDEAAGGPGDRERGGGGAGAGPGPWDCPDLRRGLPAGWVRSLVVPLGGACGGDPGRFDRWGRGLCGKSCRRRVPCVWPDLRRGPAVLVRHAAGACRDVGVGAELFRWVDGSRGVFPRRSMSPVTALTYEEGLQPVRSCSGVGVRADQVTQGRAGDRGRAALVWPDLRRGRAAGSGVQPGRGLRQAGAGSVRGSGASGAGGHGALVRGIGRGSLRCARCCSRRCSCSSGCSHHPGWPGVLRGAGPAVSSAQVTSYGAVLRCGGWELLVPPVRFRVRHLGCRLLHLPLTALTYEEGPCLPCGACSLGHAATADR